MISKEKLTFLWLTAFFILAVFLCYKISDFLTPFIISFILAYFLHPIVDFLQKKARFPRAVAALIVIGLFVFLFVGVFLLIAPAIYGRAMQIIEILPKYLTGIYIEFYPKISNYFGHYGIDLAQHMSEENIAKIIFSDTAWIGKANEFLIGFFSRAINSGSAAIEVCSLIILSPIIIFYLLKDWEVMIGKIQQNLPEKFLKPSQVLIKAINQNLSAYARGQINVCLIMALIYGVGLYFCGLESGLAIGILTGILAFIPYIGFGLGMIFAFLTAFLQWGFNFENLLPIALVFMAGQIIESNFLTPIMIGKKVGLHPLWLIFGLFFFGSIFGVAGVIFSMPLAATFAVLSKYALASLRQIRSSKN